MIQQNRLMEYIEWNELDWIGLDWNEELEDELNVNQKI